jgi:hypothetical protein
MGLRLVYSLVEKQVGLGVNRLFTQAFTNCYLGVNSNDKYFSDDVHSTSYAAKGLSWRPEDIFKIFQSSLCILYLPDTSMHNSS